MHKSYTATDYGGPEVRVRRAIDKALASELSIDTREDAAEAMVRAGLNERVVAYGREVDRLLDQLAGACAAQARQLQQERDAIHEAAREHERARLAKAERIPGTRLGPIPTGVFT